MLDNYAMSEQTDEAPNKLNFSINLKLIVGLLLAVIAVMLFMWKPWQSTTGRTVEVTGEAKVTAKPDEFIFTPTYRFPSADKDAAVAELSKKSNSVVAGLKKLGVPESKIKTSTGEYDSIYIEPQRGEPAAETNFTTNLTVTVSGQALAQKVQDYLLTTSPTGSITPQPTFSDNLRKELESKARDEATKDARTKADQMAKNLGFSLSKIKSVSDNTGFGVYPLAEKNAATTDSSRSLTIHPGENELFFSVRVVFFIR